MFDKEAIKQIQESAAIDQARQSVLSAFAVSGAVALPDDFTISDIESYMPNRRRMRGTMNTSVLGDFAGYTAKNAEEGACVFVDPDHMSATAVLNLGTPSLPGHCDNLSVLKLKQTAAYLAVRLITGNGSVSQLKAAEFLEDWPEHIKCFNDEGEIPVSQAVAALRRITIDTYRKLESSEQSLSASKSAFESVAASSTNPIPTYIYFTCVPYQELEERMFTLRLGVQTGGDKPSINLRIVKQELHQEEMARELADKVRETLKKFPVAIGTHHSR